MLDAHFFHAEMPQFFGAAGFGASLESAAWDVLTISTGIPPVSLIDEMRLDGGWVPPRSITLHRETVLKGTEVIVVMGLSHLIPNTGIGLKPHFL